MDKDCPGLESRLKKNTCQFETRRHNCALGFPSIPLKVDSHVTCQHSIVNIKLIPRKQIQTRLKVYTSNGSVLEYTLRTPLPLFQEFLHQMANVKYICSGCSPLNMKKKVFLLNNMFSTFLEQELHLPVFFQPHTALYLDAKATLYGSFILSSTDF